MPGRLNATARLAPFVVAVLSLPSCTREFPRAAIDRLPLVVCCVTLAVDDALSLVDGAAHAVGAPTQSATAGAPAHTARNLTDVLIGNCPFLDFLRARFLTRLYT